MLFEFFLRSEGGSREGVDAGCRQRTAAWVREKASTDGDIELCEFFEEHQKAGGEALLPPGVYPLTEEAYTVEVEGS